MTESDAILIELSALVDGELPTDRSAFLLRRVEQDPELRAAWERWQLVSTCLKQGAPRPIAGGFAERVSAALAEESAPSRPLGGALVRWASGGAIAAAVAVLAVIAMAPPEQLPAEPGPSAAQSVAEVAPSLLIESDLQPRFAAPAQTVAVNQRMPLLPMTVSERGLDPQAQAYLVRHQTALRQAGLVEFASYVDVLAHPDDRTLRGVARPPADEGAR